MDFMHLFKQNEAAWHIMYQDAIDKEQNYANICYNFVGVSNEDRAIQAGVKSKLGEEELDAMNFT